MSRPKLSVTSPPPPENAEQPEALWQSALDIREERLEWLLPDRIACGTFAIVEGETWVGKTTWLAGLAASVTTGAPFLGRAGGKPSSVLWVSSEESAATMIRPRLSAAGAWMGGIHFPTLDRHGRRRRLLLPSGLSMLRDGIDRHRAALIIIEPLISHVASGYDITRDGDARAIVDPLVDLAIETGAVVLVTRGLTKARGGPRTARGKGNAQVGEAARTILVIERPDEERSLRILRPIKVPAGASPVTLTYEITGPPGAPVMTGWRGLTRSEDIASESPPDHAERDVRRDAEALLRTILADGPVPASAVEAAALRAVISSGALRRAKSMLGVRSVHDGYGLGSEWRWAAPEGGFAAPLGVPAHPVAPLAPLDLPERKRPGKSKGAKGASDDAHTPKAPRKGRSRSTPPVSDATME